MDLVGIMLFVVVICLILSAIFSACETAITSVSEAKIHHLKSEGNIQAAKLQELSKDRESLLSAILVANNTVNILASSIVAGISIQIFGNEGVIYATIVMTISIILFSEILPKTYAIKNAEKVALKIVYFLKIVMIVFLPFTKFIKLCVTFIFKVFNLSDGDYKDDEAIKEELKGAIELHHSKGRVKKSDKDMLGSVLVLEDIDVKEIMIHRNMIYSLNIDLDPKEILSAALKSGYAKIPLWQGDKENIVAILSVKDLVKALDTNTGEVSIKNISDIANKPWFIPEITDLKTQLTEFIERRNHFAVVVDEYGGLEGIITLTDILEEIVGKIDDEHKQSDIKQLANDMFEVDGTVTIRDFNRYADWNLPDEEATTIAGLLIHEIEKIPEENELHVIYDTKFLVLKKLGNQILKIRLEKIFTD